MNEPRAGLKLGQKAPDFEINAYDPVADDFRKVSLKAQTDAKRWTILFFYPADFTFI